MKETVYTGQQCLSPLQCRQLGTSHSSPNRHQLSPHIFLFPLKGLILGKARSLRCQIWAVGWGLSHLCDLIFCQKTLHET